MVRVWYALKNLFLLFWFPRCWKKARAKRELLRGLIGKQIELSTPFGFLAGELVVVGKDYIELLDEMGADVFVRIAKIETIRSLS
ncbi:hypothetical protein CAY60_019150 [Shouchella clausii]|jgi:hypothetical protein|nr:MULTISPECIES: hypothetical protein [Shouchella]MCM3314270.1 hypothetical protein [Psychrobacillus sp. MER TA 17]ALA52573.1 hypothetical protein DB29_01745 [Shouchella clausii]KKI85446.1 hypothetical protein WZ76_15365 [Shouchella clausii]MBU3230019.1 hypothetical protein [Shouchella clausii]MBU3262782.1 hypothetical protein [Shouchella clausii]